MMEFIGIEGNRNCYSPDQAESCTVGELIEFLQDFDEDMPIYLVNDRGYTFGTISYEDIKEHTINNQGELDKDDVEESCSSKLSIKEEFNGWDVRSLLDQIETQWGFDTMDKMLDWLVDHSDNGKDQLDELGYYVPEELEFWIDSRKIKDVMNRCLETGKIEESLQFNKHHVHESHKVRKNKLYLRPVHRTIDKPKKERNV